MSRWAIWDSGAFQGQGELLHSAVLRWVCVSLVWQRSRGRPAPVTSSELGAAPWLGHVAHVAEPLTSGHTLAALAHGLLSQTHQSKAPEPSTPTCRSTSVTRGFAFPLRLPEMGEDELPLQLCRLASSWSTWVILTVGKQAGSCVFRASLVEISTDEIGQSQLQLPKPGSIQTQEGWALQRLDVGYGWLLLPLHPRS